MVIDLTGISPDGTPQKQGVPDNPRRTLRIPLGVDLSLRLRVLSPGGGQIDLTGATLVWTIKKKPSDGQALISKAGTIGVGVDAGSILFTLIPTDTRLIQPGLFGYDIWLTQGGQRNPVVPLSPLILEASATPVP